MSLPYWEIFISKDVICNESRFPYQDLFPTKSPPPQSVPVSLPPIPIVPPSNNPPFYLFIHILLIPVQHPPLSL